MAEFALSPEIKALRRTVRAFLEHQIYPNERILHEGGAGAGAMFIGPEAGGPGPGFLPYAYVNEILGRSPFAPRAFGCAAPDTGNAEILHQFGTQEQKDRWLKPLVAGDIRSCFSMTEPEVSGADPPPPPHPPRP